jgi:alkylhydroperoxidase family enzyme
VSPRIAFTEPPYPPFAQREFDRLMPPGIAPLGLFRILAGDERLFRRFLSGGLLDRGHLTLRQREIVIGRVTARCGSEYEWGVHVTLFGHSAKLTPAQIDSLVTGAPSDTCWAVEGERILIQVCDHVGEHCDLSDDLWRMARHHFSEHAMIEILMLNGFYRMVAYLTNALRIPLEPWAHRFPA